MNTNKYEDTGLLEYCELCDGFFEVEYDEVDGYVAKCDCLQEDITFKELDFNNE